MKKYLFALLLANAAAVAAAEKRPPPVSAPTPAPPTISEEAMGLVHEGDAYYEKRTVMQGGPEAVEAYEKAIVKDSATVEAYWKASRAAHWVGDTGTDRKKKLEWFQKGIDFAEKGIKLEPKSVESHFWLGANLGSFGEFKGVLKSLALVKPIRREMESVVRLDDRYQGGAGYRVLGVVDYKVPGFAGGSKKRALENLQKALTIDPENPFNQYYMAEYFDLMGDRGEAIEHLTALESLSTSPDTDAPTLKWVKDKGSALRKKYEKYDR